MKPALMKSTLSIAVIALFAAGCATREPVYQRSEISYVGPAGPTGAEPMGASKPLSDYRARAP